MNQAQVQSELERMRDTNNARLDSNSKYDAEMERASQLNRSRLKNNSKHIPQLQKAYAINASRLRNSHTKGTPDIEKQNNQNTQPSKTINTAEAGMLAFFLFIFFDLPAYILTFFVITSFIAPVFRFIAILIVVLWLSGKGQLNTQTVMKNFTSFALSSSVFVLLFTFRQNSNLPLKPRIS